MKVISTKPRHVVIMHGVPVHCKQAIINIFYNINALNDSVIGEASLLLMSLLRLIV